jgi:dethiobiotin synthetase
MGTKILFITGTDTGVGKTLLTALLLCYLRDRGARVLALKPFCSGGRADAELLHRLQEGDLSLDEVNPFYFPEPVAPLVSGRRHSKGVPLARVIKHIDSMLALFDRDVSRRSANLKVRESKRIGRDYLLIEGSGGLMVPLGEGYTVLDLISQLNCEVLMVSRNKLGTINHTLLTLSALRSALPKRTSLRTVLMDQRTGDISSKSNPAILREWIRPVPLVQLPFLGKNCTSPSALKRGMRQYNERLEELL